METKDHSNEIKELQATIEALSLELRKTKRELRSAKAQIERQKASSFGKDRMSSLIASDKKRRELYLNSLLQVMPEIVVFTNTELEVIMCSRSYLAAAEMTSYDEIIGTPAIPDRLEYPDGQTISGAREELLRTMHENVQTEEEIYFSFVPDRPKRYYKKYTLPIHDADGNPLGAVLLFIDVTDISMAREQAREASLAKSNFLTTMSHEIRTPMNAIIGMTDIAQNSADLSQKDYCLEKIHSASIHLLGVINDILDMSKIEANKMVMAQEEFDFERMLMRVCEVLGYTMDEKKLHFDVILDPTTPQFVISDAQRLSQVITNLMSNAVKFTPESGSITLTVKNLGLENDCYTIQIQVTDSGIGISEEQQSRLFQSFEQADNGTSRKYGGTGLGLAISKRIVEMLGGNIWVHSETGNGSTFGFTVRVGKGVALSGEKTRHTAFDSLNLMVVDDSQSVLDYFDMLSGRHHFHCDTFDNGFDAEKRFDTDSGQYNIAFVDYSMPGMNGIELARKIKDKKGSDTTVVMISALDLSDLEEDAKQAGVDRFLTKPLFPSAIVDVINECCGFEATIPNDEEATLDLSSACILLAEDIEVNQEILIALLAPTGVQIDCASDGVEALARFSANPDRYDLILMDVHMPEKDGYQTTRALRELPLQHAKNIPIIAMTANVFREDIEKCLAAGMNDHLGKPIDITEVEHKLYQYLRPLGKATLIK